MWDGREKGLVLEKCCQVDPTITRRYVVFKIYLFIPTGIGTAAEASDGVDAFEE